MHWGEFRLTSFGLWVILKSIDLGGNAGLWRMIDHDFRVTLVKLRTVSYICGLPLAFSESHHSDPQK